MNSALHFLVDAIILKWETEKSDNFWFLPCSWLNLEFDYMFYDIYFNWINFFDLFFFPFLLMFQINEEASDKVLEVEQKYNEIRKPVYDKRKDTIKSIPDFWLTAVSNLFSFSSTTLWEYIIGLLLLN